MCAQLGRPQSDPHLRFAQKIRLDEATGCWLWTGGLCPAGYGVFCMTSSQSMGAHRASFELFVGTIPPKHDVHHICKNRICCNPNHLHALDRRSHSLAHSSERTACDNGHPYVDGSFAMVMSRGYLVKQCKICRRIQQVAKLAKYRETTPRKPHASTVKTHCPKGHPLSGDNLIINSKGARVCKTCQRDAQKAWREANRPAWRRSEGMIKPFCINGHAMTPENTYTYNGKNSCRICILDRIHKSRERKRLNCNTVQKSGPESGQQSGPDMT